MPTFLPDLKRAAQTRYLISCNRYVIDFNFKKVYGYAPSVEKCVSLNIFAMPGTSGFERPKSDAAALVYLSSFEDSKKGNSRIVKQYARLI